MNDCCLKNLNKAVYIRRGYYECPVCGNDVSLAFIFYIDAIERSKEAKRRKDNE